MQKRKFLYYSLGFLVALLIIAFSINLAITMYYRSQIPVLPELQSVSSQLVQQIKDATQEAMLKPTSDNLGKLGMVYHSSAYYEQAVKCYQLAISRNKSKWIWNYYLGYLNQEMGGTNASIDNFKQVIKVDPENYFAYYYLAEAYRIQGNNSFAEAVFKKIPDQKMRSSSRSKDTRRDFFPLQTYASFKLARMFINSKRIDEAERTLLEIVQENMTYGPAYRLLGAVYNIKGDSVRSKYFITRANDLADNVNPVDTLMDKISLISRSELYILKQIDESLKSYNPEWTIKLLKNARANLPDNKYVISSAVKTYLRLDNRSLALELLNRHFSYFKEDFNEINQVAELLYQKELFNQSSLYYTQLAKLKPDNTEVQVKLAMSLADANEKEKALELMNKLVSGNKHNPKIIGDVVYSLIVLEENAKAKSLLSLLKQISPSSPQIYKLSGMLAEQDGNLEAAVLLYERAYASDHEDIMNIQYLCNNLVQLKEWKKVIWYLQDALKFHPNDSYLLERLGTVLISCPDISLRNAQEAREFSERAFIHVDCSAETLITAARSLGIAYATLDDRTNAYKYLNIALQMAHNENLNDAVQEDLSNLLKRLTEGN